MKPIPACILIAYIILVIIYSVVTPIFEAPDESYHFGFIQHLAYFPELPVQDAKVKTPWFQEGGQPPLYYILTAPIARLAASHYEPYPLEVNPHAAIGFGTAALNHNVYIHTAEENFPWKEVPLAVHLIRLLNIIFGVCTVYAVYRIALLVLPDKPLVAVIAMSLVAFNPIFLFISGSINNDNPVTMLSALAIWVMVLILQKGFTFRRIYLLAFIMPLAVLCKVSGLGLYATAGVLLVLLLYRKQITWRQALITGSLFIVAFAVLASWWFVRNIVLYHDPTAMQSLVSFMETRHEPYTFNVMLSEMDGLRYSSWGLFGWFNVLAPMWFLTLMDVLTGLALVGGVIWGFHEIRRRHFESFYPLGLLGIHFLIIFVSFIFWNKIIWATHGRLLFPAIASIAVFMALGWYSLARLPKQSPKYLEFIAFIPIIIVFIAAVLLPFTTIASAYAQPLTVTQLPADAVSVDARFGDIHIRGFRIDHKPVVAGDTLPITVYYQGAADPRNLSLYLTALDQHQQAIGTIDSYPGGGNLATSTWKPDQIYADTYALPIQPSLQDPMQAQIKFGWYSFATKEYLPATHEDGTPLDALIFQGGTLLPRHDAAPPKVKQPAIFSSALRLNGYTIIPTANLSAGNEFEVILNWEALTTVYEDFTVFVHLETPDGTLVTQNDSPPIEGFYPTSAWAPNHPFNDAHKLKVDAPGTYRIVVGFYRPKDLTRLPVDSGGDALILQTPVVVK